jgi:hypothetical protein
MYVNPRLNILSRRLLYTLKRDYGAPIDIYKNLGLTINTKTGTKTVSMDVTPVHRAVVLPATYARQMVQSTPEKIANRAFDQGGLYDTRTRIFAVDRRDTPNLSLTEDDWVVYDACKYGVVKFEEFEPLTAYFITTKQLIGEPFEQIFLLGATSYLSLQGAAATS